MFTLVTDGLNILGFQSPCTRSLGPQEDLCGSDFFILETEAPPPLGMVVWPLGHGSACLRTDGPVYEKKAQGCCLKNSCRKKAI